MKRKIGFISSISGTISMILGFIGLCMSFPICGGVCIGGILASILGISIMGFLTKHSIWLTVIGGAIFILGIFLIIKCKRKCDEVMQRYLNEMIKHYKVEKCRNCECLQGFLVQLEIDGADKKMLKRIKKMIISEGIHKCLGCEPCLPGESFTRYLMEKDKNT